MKSADELWRDVEGFTRPNCPECGEPAELDANGYWCMKCSEAEPSEGYNPIVDDIPNGYEFQEALAAYRKAAGLNRKDSTNDA